MNNNKYFSAVKSGGEFRVTKLGGGNASVDANPHRKGWVGFCFDALQCNALTEYLRGNIMPLASHEEIEPVIFDDGFDDETVAFIGMGGGAVDVRVDYKNRNDQHKTHYYSLGMGDSLDLLDCLKSGRNN